MRHMLNNRVTLIEKSLPLAFLPSLGNKGVKCLEVVKIITTNQKINDFDKVTEIAKGKNL